MDELTLVLLFIVIVLLAYIQPLFGVFTAGAALGVLAWLYYHGELDEPVVSAHNRCARSERFIPDTIYDNTGIDPMIQSSEWKRDQIAPPTIDTPADNLDLLDQSINESSIFAPQEQLGSTLSYAGDYNFNSPFRHKIGRYLQPNTNMGSDERSARLQMHRGSIEKKALDGANRESKTEYLENYANELGECEQLDWWSAEAYGPEFDFQL